MCNFYCQKLTGDANFSIEDWNEQYNLCIALEIEMPHEHEKMCDNQCNDCINIVLDTREKNKHL